MRESNETTTIKTGDNDMEQENNHPYQWVKEAAQFKHAAQLFALATLQPIHTVEHALNHPDMVKGGVLTCMGKINMKKHVPLSDFASNVWDELVEMKAEGLPMKYIHGGKEYTKLLARIYSTMKSNGFDKEELDQIFNHANHENMATYTKGMHKWGNILYGLDLT